MKFNLFAILVTLLSLEQSSSFTPIKSIRIKSQLRSTETDNEIKLTFSLAQSFDIQTFLNSKLYSASNNIGGVYVLESNDDKTYFVGHSSNLIDSIHTFYNNNNGIQSIIKSIRLQTFSIYNEDAVIAYKTELIRITNPPGNLPGSNLKLTLSTSSSTTDATTTTTPKQSKLEKLRNAINTNIANTSINKSSKPLTNPIIEYDQEDTSRPPTTTTTTTQSTPNNVIISPFQSSKNQQVPIPSTTTTTTNTIDTEVKLATCENTLDFTAENVNKVLDEVRPYLLAVWATVVYYSVLYFHILP